jgi:periplasmic divalent cation tolerance protein
MRVVLTTTATVGDVAALARTLVEERLAACASLLPGLHSLYRWQGAVEEAEETLLLLKTSAENTEALEARLHALHPYETPEFLVLDQISASAPYLNWLLDSLRAAD